MILCKKCGQEIPATDPLPTLCPHCAAPLSESLSEENTTQSLDPDEDLDELSEEELDALVEEPVDDSPLNLLGEIPEQIPVPASLADPSLPEDPADPESSANAEEATAPKKGKLGLILGILAALALLACLYIGLVGQPKQVVTADTHLNPTALRYTTSKEIGLVEDGKKTPLFVNDAADLNESSSISQMFLTANPTISNNNYVKLDNGDLITIENLMANVGADGQPDMNGRLILRKGDAEPVVLDENAQFIYCNNGTSLYYNKLEDKQVGENLVSQKMVQSRYQDGKIISTDELLEEKNAMVFQVSDDSSLLSLSLFTEELTLDKMGYRYKDTNHFFEKGYQIFSLTPDGKNLYVIKSDPESNLNNLYRVKDLATGELEQLGSKVSKISLYDEDGSLAFIADCVPGDAETDPVGSIYYYDAAANTTSKMADKATTILDAYTRNFGWYNENAKSVTPCEYSTESSASAMLVKGQIHYIDVAGDFKVIKLGSTPGESGLDGVLLSDAYAKNESSSLPSLVGDSLYWSMGSEVYRYKLGSLSTPVSLSLGENLNEKADAGAQMGYIISGSGDVLEETGNALLLKNFEKGESKTILEDMGKITIIGLDNDGKQLYFISEDQTLYSKSLQGKGNPKMVLSNVYNAAASTDGLYILQNYDQTTGGSLSFLKYDEKMPVPVSEGVLSMMAIAVK